MSRYHWFGFVVNEAGEPISDCEVTVSLAGTDEPAKLYYDEYGTANSFDNPTLSGGPQLTTLSNGYYEFWIADQSDDYGYTNDQKFKLEWVRVGVAYGQIDYISVLPLSGVTEQVDISDCSNNPSIIKNKLVSDSLACKWETHTDSLIVSDAGFVSVHGLAPVDPTDSESTVKNKVVSNADIYLLNDNESGYWDIDTSEWSLSDDDSWAVSIDHNLNIYYPFVQVYNKTTKRMISADILYVSDDSIIIYLSTTPVDDYIVRIGQGGIQRHP